jgi:hypothetical protein
VLRLPAELPPPAPGTVLQDVEALGRPVPGTGAGVVVDELGPGSAAGYVVVTLDGATAVAGAAVVVADPAPVRGLRATGDLLSWEWPPGCTEALVVWRTDAPPAGPDDPRAQRRKTTNTRYELDGGAPLPPARPLHLAVHACVRVRGALVPALSAPPDAQLRLGAADGPGTVAHRH